MYRITHSLYQAFYNTPPLWQGAYEGLDQFAFPEVTLDHTFFPQIPQNLRLGHQMEFIFHQLLLHSNTYNVLAYNIPIRKNKISLGEIDFIVQNNTTGQLIHLELTYKFYILTDTSENALDQQLIGPNYRDTFVLKKEKLKTHQLPLSRSLEGTQTLRDHGIDPIKLTPQVCFKSQLFTPFYKRNSHLTPFNSECISGSWISILDFDSDEFKSYQYYIPTKLEWILNPHNDIDWCSYSSILDRISGQLASKNSPLVWVKGTTLELKKMFIIWR
ncbi:hypothetical protein KCTC52924_03175 [Arenibacter antarcticus]|uniref:DUF1853 family protein n=1 Tax=Arenibacter antarcticus TaxID=2040469 RepID=A0ABW5VG83_9FLAO|nr:DUF1853 family protein [Arenibacter sp. H213]MCM4166250.1 hypothetical protein [Arenibacter sp. H213]